jgi:outer membrane protein
MGGLFHDWKGEGRNMKHKRLLVAFCCILLSLALFGTSYAADSKVGYVNLQRLVSGSKMGQAAKNEIQKLRVEKQAVIDKKGRDIKKFQKFINEEGDKMPPREKQQKIEGLQKAYKIYQRLVADAKEDITREDKQLVSIILDKADGALKKVAKQYKYSIILKDPNAIGYLDPDYDITDLVIKELNKGK